MSIHIHRRDQKAEELLFSQLKKQHNLVHRRRDSPQKIGLRELLESIGVKHVGK